MLSHTSRSDFRSGEGRGEGVEIAKQACMICVLTCFQDFIALKVKCGQWAHKCKFWEAGKCLLTLLGEALLGNTLNKYSFY